MGSPCLFYIQYFITFTNIFALIPIYGFISAKNYWGTILMISMLICSTMKHLTETKNGLPGKLYSAKSIRNALFWLRMDRLFAILIIIFSMNLFYNKASKSIYDILLPMVSFSFFMIGELTNNLIIYAACHSVWHFGVYMSVYQII